MEKSFLEGIYAFFLLVTALGINPSASAQLSCLDILPRTAPVDISRSEVNSFYLLAEVANKRLPTEPNRIEALMTAYGRLTEISQTLASPTTMPTKTLITELLTNIEAIQAHASRTSAEITDLLLAIGASSRNQFVQTLTDDQIQWDLLIYEIDRPNRQMNWISQGTIRIASRKSNYSLTLPIPENTGPETSDRELILNAITGLEFQSQRLHNIDQHISEYNSNPLPSNDPLRALIEGIRMEITASVRD